MASVLSNLSNNLYEGIHKIKCKYRLDDTKCETFGMKYKYCDCFIEHTEFKDDLTEYKWLCCNKNYQQNFDKKLRNNFSIHTNFLTTTTISLFYCCEKVFTLMSIRMIGNNSAKHHYLEKKIFTVT